MREYDQDLDEYEDELEGQYGDVGADQYDDEEGEEEEEEEEEEAVIPEEKLRYLDLRQKLKEEARSKIRKENGESGNKSQDRKGVPAPSGKFGSFFGPSRPVVADRVIQESKSLLETRHLAAKQSIAQKNEKKVTMSSSTSISNSKYGGSNKPLSSQVKTKAQSIRQTRDFYSSLWTDDVEPKPGGNAAGSQKHIAPKTDGRSAQVSAKSSEPSTSSRKGAHVYEQKKPSSRNLQSRAGQAPRPQKSISSSRHNLVSPESKRQLDLRKVAQSSKHLGRSNSTGPARPAVAKVMPPKKPLPSSDRKMPSGAMERKASVPAGVKTSTAGKNPISNGQRFPSVKSQTSVVRKPVVDRRDIPHNNRDGRMLKDMPTSKSQKIMNGQTLRPPPKQEPVCSNMARDRRIKEHKPSGKFSVQKSSASRDPYIKKRRADDAFSDEELDYRSAIRAMFGRPKHYNDVDDDDDDMCMESGFDDILREERRSAKIAKKEDDEELEKIMEEERQEKLRRESKLRKKQHMR